MLWLVGALGTGGGDRTGAVHERRLKQWGGGGVWGRCCELEEAGAGQCCTGAAINHHLPTTLCCCCCYCCCCYCSCYCCGWLTATSLPVPLLPQVHLRLADCYLHKTKVYVEYACDVYTTACALMPCCSTWLGAGRCQLLLGQYEQAELALAEANVLDAENPEVWGLLVQLALQSAPDGQRLGEVSAALKYAVRCGLRDEKVFLEAAAMYRKLGHWRSAQGVLQSALQLANTLEIRRLLAESLLEQVRCLSFIILF